jgi:hypothetical protein
MVVTAGEARGLPHLAPALAQDSGRSRALRHFQLLPEQPPSPALRSKGWWLNPPPPGLRLARKAMTRMRHPLNQRAWLPWGQEERRWRVAFLP